MAKLYQANLQWAISFEVVMERITTMGADLGYSPSDIARAVDAFKNPRINMTIERFAEGIARFKNVEGGRDLINNTFKHLLNPEGHNRANGCIYELSGTCTLEALENEPITKLTIKIIEKGKLHNEYDFMSNNYLGESKNAFCPIAYRSKRI